MHLLLLKHYAMKNTYMNAFIMCHHTILVGMYAFAISYAIFMHLGSEEEITLLEFDEVDTSREQTFHPMLKWALVPTFFAPGTRKTFSPGWCLQPGLKVPAQRLLRSAQWQGRGPLVLVGDTNRD